MTPTEPGWRSVQASFVQTWQRVMTDPHGFFAEMPQAGGLQDPGTFLLITAGINAVGHLITGFGIMGALASLVFQVVLAFIVAALFTVIAQQLFEGKAGFEPTFRVVAYSTAPLVFAWVPFIDTIASMISLNSARSRSRVRSDPLAPPTSVSRAPARACRSVFRASRTT